MTTPVLTDEEARERLGIGSNDQVDMGVLSSFNTAATEFLESTIGPIVQGTVTELHSGAKNGIARTHIYLKQAPVGTVTQVVEYCGTIAGTLTEETNAVKPSAGYMLSSPTSGKLLRRANGCVAQFPTGERNVQVSYTAGRYTAGTLVPERYKQAVTYILKNAWRLYEDSTTTLGEFVVPSAAFPTFAMPKAVIELLGDQWNTGSGIGD